jgi:hypothetical protein
MAARAIQGDLIGFIATMSAAFNADRVARVSTNPHVDAYESPIAHATLSGTDAAAQAAAVKAANEMMVRYLEHIADTVAHKAAWAAPALVAATDVATAETLVNAIQADYANHIADTASHYNADATNTWLTTVASNLATLQTLWNAGKTKVNAHMAAALGGQSVRIVAY